MTSTIADLESRLSSAPEDWALRIRLIEERVRRGEMDAAKRLVRESPDSAPLPFELQHRLHTLMTRGVAALEAPAQPEPEPAPPRQSPHGMPPRTRHAGAEIPMGVPRKKSPAPEKTEPAAKEPPGKKPLEKVELKKTARAIGIPQINLNEVREKKEGRWKNYDGDFILEQPEADGPQRRLPSGARKVSALSMALLFHFALLVSVGFVVIHLPRPRPPVLIASMVTHERTAELLPTRITPKSRDYNAAAAASAAHVIGSAAASPFSVPQMDQPRGLDVTALITGIRPDGRGLSFTANAREMSDVNFFGISAGGKKIVFIVDAGKYMLVDERGGMFAYDKVKNEIGQMLAHLNRGTLFNVLLYEDDRVLAFREDMVPALPSNLRLAIEWMDPVNRVYENLGLRAQPGAPVDVAGELKPIQSIDLAHYTKAIQKSFEWGAGAIFCITGDYFPLDRSPTPEMLEKMKKDGDDPDDGDSAPRIDPNDRKAWNEARQKALDWLRKENEARAAKGIAPKVVLNFNDLVRKITGMTPPRPSGGAPGNPGNRPPRLGPYAPEDIEEQIKNGVRTYYRNEGNDPPSIHIVLFLGEDQEVLPDVADHFKNLTRKNNGKLKVLRGLAALQDVTGTSPE